MAEKFRQSRPQTLIHIFMKTTIIKSIELSRSLLLGISANAQVKNVVVDRLNSSMSVIVHAANMHYTMGLDEVKGVLSI